MFDNETGSNARTPASTAPAPVPDVRRWAPASAMPTATERMRHGPLFPILVGGLAGAILGLGLALVQPRVYEAGTRVSLPPVASEAPKGKTDPRIEALRERVLTDDVLRRVVSQLGLASDKDLAGAPDGLSGSAEIARAAEALRRRVAVLPAGADQADIRVRFGEGAKAARIADALAATIVANPPVTAPMPAPIPAPIPAPSSAPVAAAPGASVARNAVAPSAPATTAPIAAARSGPALPPDAAVVALLEQRLAQASEARRAAEAALRAAREDGRAEAPAELVPISWPGSMPPDAASSARPLQGAPARPLRGRGRRCRHRPRPRRRGTGHAGGGAPRTRRARCQSPERSGRVADLGPASVGAGAASGALRRRSGGGGRD